MLAAAVPAPHTVTLHWLRLAGLIALCCTGVGIYFLARRSEHVTNEQWTIYAMTGVGVLAHLAAVQTTHTFAARAAALATALAAIAVAVMLLHPSPHQQTSAEPGPPATATLWTIASTLGAATLCGAVLMDMLLGHAYLTAATMTMAPFRRLTSALGIAIIVRAIFAVGATVLIERSHPLDMFWDVWGLYIGTRWLVGLLVPAIFVFMVRDCIARRATQSATGILYVAGVLVFLGEMIALWLVRETGLPF